MPSPLQKPTRTSKRKYHNAALIKCMDLWENGDVKELIEESMTIQCNLKSVDGIKSIEEISKQNDKMSKGNINGAIKLLTNKFKFEYSSSQRKKLLICFRQKHPEPKDAPQDVLFNDEVPPVHSVKFEEINRELIKKVDTKTRGAGPSGLDGMVMTGKRLLTSNSF